MTKDKIKEIKKFTEELLKIMGFEAQIKVELKEKVIFVDIQLEEAGSLIGFRGENLSSLEHILRAVISKNEYTPLVLNIGQYRQKQEDFIKQKALGLAVKVRQTKRPEVMMPMSAWERRIVHLALAEEKDIETESVGAEPNRRIIIKIKE